MVVAEDGCNWALASLVISLNFTNAKNGLGLAFSRARASRPFEGKGCIGLGYFAAESNRSSLATILRHDCHHFVQLTHTSATSFH